MTTGKANNAARAMVTKALALGLVGLAAACSGSGSESDASRPSDAADGAGDLPGADAPAVLDLGAPDGGGELCSKEIGAGSLTGTFDGQPLVATHAAGVKAVIGNITAHYVGFFDQGGPCSAFYPEGPFSQLYITLCQVTPGTYAVGSACVGQDSGVGLSVSNEVKIPRLQSSDAAATSGTITIVAFDLACGGAVRGSFDVSFDGQPVTGTFDTFSCGTVYPTH